MLSFKEFDRQSKKREAIGLCRICDKKTIEAVLCPDHLMVWSAVAFKDEVDYRKWNYEQYRQNLIKNTINVWKIT